MIVDQRVLEQTLAKTDHSDATVPDVIMRLSSIYSSISKPSCAATVSLNMFLAAASAFLRSFRVL